LESGRRACVTDVTYVVNFSAAGRAGELVNLRDFLDRALCETHCASFSESTNLDVSDGVTRSLGQGTLRMDGWRHSGELVEGLLDQLDAAFIVPPGRMAIGYFTS